MVIIFRCILGLKWTYNKGQTGRPPSSRSSPTILNIIHNSHIWLYQQNNNNILLTLQFVKFRLEKNCMCISKIVNTAAEIIKSSEEGCCRMYFFNRRGNYLHVYSATPSNCRWNDRKFVGRMLSNVLSKSMVIICMCILGLQWTYNNAEAERHLLALLPNNSQNYT